ncbi:hypothetical protein Q7C36_014952 [Tachysurus vachellii]|uniref:Uncharacterized protein n=1 Tax=Tachysurus vachellii TaxID=175792 RepID=A0AA88MBE3_TACVA|nr:hypothetical protein Q7C36_014952 [Tachysurus vachellii]
MDLLGRDAVIESRSPHTGDDRFIKCRAEAVAAESRFPAAKSESGRGACCDAEVVYVCDMFGSYLQLCL